MNPYLQNTEIIDWQDPLILSLAKELAKGLHLSSDIGKSCYDWVRDQISHSYDFKLGPVTCKASDVLKYGTGYCYAKSHLLAALLRANQVPTGFCYQRLRVGEKGGPFCLHGLNAVFLPEHGWYRVDPRGNKEGVDAQFNPPVERLAFPITSKFEADLPEIWPQPLSVVVEVLTKYATYQDVYENLPDVSLILQQRAGR
ncbi:MAG: transglutaminase family protein [Proteobacteria bacterium]|nr:transglutaminase family protein [Pseudomonadota bacterium]MBU1717119.1 transglutaminase family protein [Pseudomonadota bacterium]